MCRDFGRTWRRFGMHGGAHSFGPQGFAFSWGFGPGNFRSWAGPSREEQIRWLEEYQRDLEQEILDVAARIKELRQETPD